MTPPRASPPIAGTMMTKYQLWKKASLRPQASAAPALTAAPTITGTSAHRTPPSLAYRTRRSRVSIPLTPAGEGPRLCPARRRVYCPGIVARPGSAHNKNGRPPAACPAPAPPVRCTQRSTRMDIQLTEEQRLALQSGGATTRLVDPVTQTAYVLVRADTYARLQALLGEEIDVRDAYPAIDRAFAEGWNDPRMDDYDRYEELKP